MERLIYFDSSQAFRNQSLFSLKNIGVHFSSNLNVYPSVQISKRQRQYLRNKWKAVDSIGLFRLEHDDHIVLYQEGARGPSCILAEVSDTSISVSLDPRWIAAFPDVHIDQLEQPSTSLDFSRVETAELGSGYVIIPFMSSISHFFAEVFPLVWVACNTQGIDTICVVDCLSWQEVLIQQACDLFAKHFVRLRLFNQKSGYTKRVMRFVNAFWIHPPPFYIGLQITETALAKLYLDSDTDCYSAMENVINGRELTIQSPSPSVYLSRLYHDTISCPADWPRTFNGARLAKDLYKRGFTVICPEKYTFWALYRLVASANNIICDNGSSQVISLISKYFSSKLATKSGLLTPLFSPRIYDAELAYTESLLWYINVIDKRGFNPLLGTLVNQYSYSPWADSVTYDISTIAQLLS